MLDLVSLIKFDLLLALPILRSTLSLSIYVNIFLNLYFHLLLLRYQCDHCLIESMVQRQNELNYIVHHETNRSICLELI